MDRIQKMLESAADPVAAAITDLRAQWSVGTRTFVEEYTAVLPDLEPPQELQLIDAEITAREANGETINIHEYLERFPASVEALKERFSIESWNLQDTLDTAHTVEYSAESKEALKKYRPVDRSTPEIEGYTFLNELGRGAAGIVFKARQLDLNRDVAVKLVRSGRLASAEERMRFQLEAETVALLAHPNIVQVYDAGQYEDQFYLAMEFVDGRALDDNLAEWKQKSLEEITRLIETLCRAIHLAHQRGIVHRDLKPANVLLTNDGVPKVSDFGLAKRLSSSVSCTQTGAIMGTPRYMAPEQARGDTNAVGPAADIYALGSMLYELLAGQPAFTSESVLELLKDISEKEPQPLRQVNPRVPRDLETICHKCLAKDASKRYATAADMADDLVRFRGRQPIRARHVTRIERGLLWARRKPLIASLAGVIGLLALLMCVGFGSYHIRLRNERDSAQRRFRLASEVVDEMLVEIGEEHLIAEPGFEERRRALLRKALAFCQKLAAEEPTERHARRQLGFAYQRMGDIRRAIGEYEQAGKAYQRAISILSTLAEELPQDTEVIRQLAAAHNFQGELLRTTGKNAEAKERYQEAMKLQRQLVEVEQDRDVVADLARSHYNLGLVAKNDNELELSLSELIESARLTQDLMAIGRASNRNRQYLARAKLNQGSVLRILKRYDEADVAYTEAIHEFEELVARDRNTTDYRFELAIALSNYGNLLASTDRARAVDVLQRSRNELMELGTQFPGVSLVQQELSNTSNSYGVVLAQSGKRTEAAAAWQVSVAALSRIIESHKATPTTHADLGMCLGNIGKLHLLSSEYANAEEQLIRGIDELEVFLHVNPQHPSYLNTAVRQTRDLAKVYCRQQEFAKALTTADDLLERFRDRASGTIAYLAFLQRCVMETEKLADVPEAADWKSKFQFRFHAKLQAAWEDDEIGTTIRERTDLAQAYQTLKK